MDNGQAGSRLHSLRIETLPKKIGYGNRSAAAQVTTEKQGTINVKARRDSGPNEVGSSLAVINKTRFAEKRIRTDQAGDQSADNQNSGRFAPGNKVIVQFLDAPACVIAYGNVHNQANGYGGGIDIHREETIDERRHGRKR